jgi:hypothetical protein
VNHVSDHPLFEYVLKFNVPIERPATAALGIEIGR